VESKLYECSLSLILSYCAVFFGGEGGGLGFELGALHSQSSHCTT
jgi:hypothetical protein